MPEICMLVMNSVVADPRVTREAELLSSMGNSVTVIGLSHGSYEEFNHNGYQIIRIKKPAIVRLISLAKNKKFATQLYQETGLDQSEKNLLSIFKRLKSIFISIIFDLGGISLCIANNIFMAFAAMKLKKKYIYHSHDLDTLLAGYLCARIKRAKLIYDFHEAYPEQFSPGTRTWIWKYIFSALERLLIHKAGIKITVCNSLRNWAIRRYGSDNVVVIMNVPWYKNYPNPEKRPSEKIVLYQGYFFKDRGIEQLIESFKYIRGARLILRGYGPTETLLRRIASDKGLEKKIIFASPVKMEELIKYASEADIGIIPYIGTNLNNQFATPNKLFEYMMAGLAIAGSDLPELRSIILGNNIGKVFNPTDPEDIARTVNEMLSDESLLSKMRNNSIKAAKEKYNWENEGRKLIAIYERLSDNRGLA